MKTHSNRKLKIQRICSAHLVLVITFIAITALAASIRAGLAPTVITTSPIPAISSRASALATLEDNSSSNEMEVDLVAILPTGFEPAEYTRPSGRFLLDVENRSGLDEITLQLYRETGEKLREVRVPHSKLDWSDILDLHPGSYVLTEADHPDWTCHITITPR